MKTLTIELPKDTVFSFTCITPDGDEYTVSNVVMHDDITFTKIITIGNLSKPKTPLNKKK